MAGRSADEIVTKAVVTEAFIDANGVRRQQR